MSKKDKFGSLLAKKSIQSFNDNKADMHDQLFNSDINTNENVYTSVNTSEKNNRDKEGAKNMEEMLDIAERIAVANKKNKTVKFEDKHSKQTYWIRNDVLKALNKIVGNRRGEKTKIINEALIDYFAKLEKELDK